VQIVEVAAIHSNEFSFNFVFGATVNVLIYVKADIMMTCHQ